MHGKGDVIAGTGGLKKIRMARPDRGKRGGYRVLFADYQDLGVCILITVFAKSGKANVTATEAKALRKTKAILDVEVRRTYGSEVRAPMVKRQTKSSSFFEEAMAGLTGAIDDLRDSRKLVTRRRAIVDPPPPMPPEAVTRLRKDKLRVSQGVFAQLLNVSVQTVHAWEQGRNKPSGIALRLIRLIEANPHILTDLLSRRHEDGKSAGLAAPAT